MVSVIQNLNSIFKGHVQSSAFLDLQGQIVSIQSGSAQSFLSPVQAVRFAITYFPMKSGDWIALNDPHSGGVTPHGLNVMGRIDHLIWSVRLESSMPWTLDEKWESMGHKIPPLPLKLQGQWNSQIPKIFLDKIQHFLDPLAPLVEKLERYIRWKKSELNEESLKEHFKLSLNAVKSILKETPWTESQHKARTQSGETLSAKINFSEKGALIDLSGTSQCLKLQISEKVVDSILVYSLNKSLNSFSLYNQGTENLFQITKPRQSWLSHNEPKFPAQSHFIGLPFLESHLKQMLLKMKRPVEDWSCSKDGWFQIRNLKQNKVLNYDDFFKSWGQGCDFIKLVGTKPLGFSFEVQDECELIKVQSGVMVQQILTPDQIWEISLF